MAANVETNAVRVIERFSVGFRAKCPVYLMEIETMNMQIVEAECSAKLLANHFEKTIEAVAQTRVA